MTELQVIYNKMDLNVITKYFVPKSILDIGANIGQFYNECKLVFPDAYYYLIEGNIKCGEVLQNYGVDYSLELLSDEKKEVTFYKTTYDEKCTGNSLYRENTSFYDDNHLITEERVTTTLESLLMGKYFDLIKIDVQGAELDIIKGGLDIVKNSKGVILEVSLIEYNQDSPTKDNVYEFMSSIGFNHSEIVGRINHPLTHELIQHDVLFVKINN